MKTAQKGLALGGMAMFAAILLLLPAMASWEVPDASGKQLYNPKETKVMIVGTGQDTQFYPSTLIIKPGDSIVFIDQDGVGGGVLHSVRSIDSTVGGASGFVSGPLHVGEIYKIKLEKAGTYLYIDPTYPHAVGTIIVAP